MPQEFIVNTGSVALVAATAKYVLGLITPATQDAALTRVRFSFDGSVSTGNNVLVEVLTWTTDGTGTAVTPWLAGPNQNKAALTTAKSNYTVAPSGTITVRDSFWLPPNVAPYYEYEPLGQELEVLISTKIGFRITSPSANNIITSVLIKE